MPFPLTIPTSPLQKPQKGPRPVTPLLLGSQHLDPRLCWEFYPTWGFQFPAAGSPREPSGVATSVNAFQWCLRIPNNPSGTAAGLGF